MNSDVACRLRAQTGFDRISGLNRSRQSVLWPETHAILAAPGVFEDKRAVLYTQPFRARVGGQEMQSRLSAYDLGGRISFAPVLSYGDWSDETETRFWIEAADGKSFLGEGPVSAKLISEYCELLDEYRRTRGPSPRYTGGATMFHLSYIDALVQRLTAGDTIVSPGTIAGWRGIVSKYAADQRMEQGWGLFVPSAISRRGSDRYELTTSFDVVTYPEDFELAAAFAEMLLQANTIDSDAIFTLFRECLRQFRRMSHVGNQPDFEVRFRLNLATIAMSELGVDHALAGLLHDRIRLRRVHVWASLLDALRRYFAEKSSSESVVGALDNPFDLAKAAVQRGAWQKVPELAALVERLKARQLRAVIEIGTAKGGTLFAWCSIAEASARIISIDLPGGDFGGGYDVNDIDRFMTYRRGAQSLHFIREDSHDRKTQDKVSALLAGTKADFLFIDGDHRYEGVAADFEMYRGFVNSGGVVAFHDIVPTTREANCEVDRFWQSLKNRYQVEELIYDDSVYAAERWGGIGLVYV